MQTATVYQGQSQVLHLDQKSNSKYWSVRSKNMSFTYFEVPQQTKFERHKHHSEQITYVLDGELWFEVDEIVYCLKKGDTIVIPSSIEHSVWTNDMEAKAIDAWTPANEKY
jgi:quercetin dioxygenase-like cupin family protein